MKKRLISALILSLSVVGFVSCQEPSDPPNLYNGHYYKYVIKYNFDNRTVQKYLNTFYTDSYKSTGGGFQILNNDGSVYLEYAGQFIVSQYDTPKTEK